MEYQKTTNLLDKTADQPSKFRTRKWVEVNYDAWGTYKVGKQVKFCTSMLNSSLCHYVNACILAKGTINITGAGVDTAAMNKK